MTRVAAGILLGAFVGMASMGACALDESGTPSDGSTLDVTTDVFVDGGGPDGQDAPADVTYDIPDLGVFETESGLPCTCVPSVPSGYTVVEYVPTQRPSCTTGYASPNDYVENPTAPPPTCTCTCGASPTSGSCSCGANPATFNISNGNGSCNSGNLSVVANANSCYNATQQQLQPNGNGLNNMQAAPANNCAGQVTCAGPTKTAIIPDASVEQGRACALTAATTTCSGGTCVPSQGAPYSMCVTKGTLDPCPPDFPIPHTVGGGVSDTRACIGQCSTCSSVDAGSCGVPQLTLYETDMNCGTTGSSVTMPANNSTCVAAGYGNGTTFNSAEYTISHTGGACAFTGSFGAAGSLTLSGAIHVCCR